MCHGYPIAHGAADIRSLTGHELEHQRRTKVVSNPPAGCVTTQCNHSGLFHPSETLLRASSMQNSPQSLPPAVLSTSSAIASSRSSPYLFWNSSFTISRCRGSQWSRTRREINSSDRSLPVRDSRRAWCRSRASRMGRLITPFRICARVSPYRVSVRVFHATRITYHEVLRFGNHIPRKVPLVPLLVGP